MASLHPYLHFNGNAEAAFNYYKTVFGGDFHSFQRYKDMPSQQQMADAESNRILHVSLPIGNGSVLMGSDIPEAYGAATPGTNFYISISTETEEETRHLFSGLSAGGEVMMPLDKTFWGALFGMLKDKFGIQWMISFDLQSK